MKIRPTAALAYSLAAATAVFSNAAWGQAAVAGDSAQPVALSDQIEVVTVTAQKRKEDPNKVAMSISAVSGAALQAQHVTDFSDLTRIVTNCYVLGMLCLAGCLTENKKAT